MLIKSPRKTRRDALIFFCSGALLSKISPGKITRASRDLRQVDSKRPRTSCKVLASTKNSEDGRGRIVDFQRCLFNSSNTFQNESLRTLSQNAKLTIDQKVSGMLMRSSLCSFTNYRARHPYGTLFSVWNPVKIMATNNIADFRSSNDQRRPM